MSAVGARPPGATVLLVDDQPMIGEAVRRMLAPEADITLHYCPDPTEAVALANQVNPTVILQDLVMPQMDGLMLVRFFRANPRTREIPLIVLSTKEEPAVKAEAFARGANDYLVKLPDRLELLARIRHHSKGYVATVERAEAFAALQESQRGMERRNRFIREVFGRYLSDEVVESLLETPEGLRLGGEKRKVTVMMADLRGFTSLSEHLPPEKVVSIINTYLEVMTEVIVRYQGTIDEFIGDAILGIFGAPILRPDDAERAVACALEMLLGMAKVNQRNRDAGLPEVAMGIGLNTGEVVVGNIGSTRRAKYGVVGAAVNLTSRVESYTVGGQLLISPSTYAETSAILEVDDQMLVEPKGVKAPITISSVVGIKGKHNLHLPRVQEDLHPQEPPILVEVRVVEGKDAGTEAAAGRIVRLSRRDAVLRVDPVPPALANVRLDVHAAGAPRAVYAKVRGAGPEPGTCLVRFTSLPHDVSAFLDAAGARLGG